MSRKIQQLSIFVFLFLIGCASQGNLTGGPADEKGPTLITVQPANASLNITQDQKITLTFDELLAPISIPASIQIEFDLDYKLKIRGRKLIIYPEKIWPVDGIVRINIFTKYPGLPKKYDVGTHSVDIQYWFEDSKWRHNWENSWL